MKQLTILRACIRIGIAIVIVGVLFSILHYPAWYEIVIVGSSMIFIAYPILFFKRSDYTPLSIVKLALVESFLLRLVLRLGHLPGGEFFHYAFLVLLVVFLVMGGSKDFVQKGPKENLNFIQRNVHYFLFILIVIVVIGSLFKIMHWPGANELLTVGFLGVAVLIISSIRRPF